MSGRVLRRWSGFALGTSVAAFAVVAIAQQVAATGSGEVAIDDFRFAPADLTVAPGTRVTWTNRDQEPHTVVSVDKDVVPFKSQALDTDDKFAFVFDKAGTYKYFCSVHPRMVGTVTVK
jgi:plastocyanin